MKNIHNNNNNNDLQINAGNFISGLNTHAIDVMRYKRRNYRLDKRGTSGYGPENYKDNDIGQMFVPESVEDCIETESRGLYDYLKESKIAEWSTKGECD